MTAIQDLMTQHLDVWTGAVKNKATTGRGSSKKIELTGVKKLRELILELAVRGKLVPQDPNDEPAAVLLEKIAAEKAQLIKDGKIKKQKALPVISDDEKPFDLPKGWEWSRLGNVVINRDAERVPLSRSERTSMKGDYDYYGASGVIDAVDSYIFDQTLLLIGEDGANLLSRSTPIAFLAHGKYWVNNHAHVLDGITIAFLRYLCIYINAISLAPYVTGTAQPKMNQAKMNTIVLAIPSENEQHRIVAKVDELMALCDQLESQTEQSISAHQTLVEVLLNTLIQSADAADFEQNWQRIANHFDFLFTTEHSIEQLKQTILQLAVMGKLVRQDPNDEPASVLLEKIAAEKARLIAEKKIKRQKALPEITDEEKPYDLPQGWGCERIGNLTVKLGSGSTPRGGKSAYVASGIRFLRSQNIWNDGLHLDDIVFIPIDTHKKMEATKVEPFDVLLNITGASLGRTVIFPEELVEANVSQHVTIIRLIERNMVEYIHLGILSPMIQKFVWGRQVGMAIEGLSKKVLELFEFPIPPLAEQKRIVTKVNQLTAICDQLLSKIRQNRATQVDLAEALVKQGIQ